MFLAIFSKLRTEKSDRLLLGEKQLIIKTLLLGPVNLEMYTFIAVDDSLRNLIIQRVMDIRHPVIKEIVRRYVIT